MSEIFLLYGSKANDEEVIKSMFLSWNIIGQRIGIQLLQMKSVFLSKNAVSIVN